MLRTRVIGRQIRHFESTASTGWIAKKLAAETDPEKLHGMVIIAEEQTGGVGRLGRAWVSPAGGIWITILLKPKIPLDHLFMITMPGRSRLPVPSARSTASVRSSSGPTTSSSGGTRRSPACSWNLLPRRIPCTTPSWGGSGSTRTYRSPISRLPLKDILTSLQAEVGHEVDRVALLARVLREFELRYQQLEDGEYDSIIREWKSLSMTIDQRVVIKTINKTFAGEAIDIDAHGALIIRKDNGKVERVIAGDCFQF